MKEIRRSRRPRPPRRRHQLTGPMTSDDDEPDFERRISRDASTVRTNRNANRMPTALSSSLSTRSMKDKQAQPLPSSSDQSSLFLYSIRSMQKPTVISDDLTPLTLTSATNKTLGSILSLSHTQPTDASKVRLDLTQLSSSDTLATSTVNSDHNQTSHLSTDTRIASSTISHGISEIVYTCETDARLKPASSLRMNESDRAPIQWHLQSTIDRFKWFIACSSLSLIAGLVILLIIL